VTLARRTARLARAATRTAGSSLAGVGRASRAALAAATLAAATAAAGEPPVVLLDDAFDGPALDPARWTPARAHDVRAEKIALEAGRLVVALDTIGADDRTVKLRGVRTAEPVSLAAGERLRVRVVLDWNDPENGSYLTAGLALVPADADGAPHAAREALAFEFVGVPPGRTARPSLWRRQAGGLRPLYREGWPEDREGRRIGQVAITLEVTPDEVALLEDGEARYRGPGGMAGDLHLLLFVTSHSNYRERAVLFEEVRLEREREPPPSDPVPPSDDPRSPERERGRSPPNSPQNPEPERGPAPADQGSR